MPTTQENLEEAFAGESQTNQKYRTFAKKAERGGFPNIAKLFKTATEAERIHAEGHLVLNLVSRKKTVLFAESLQLSI